MLLHLQRKEAQLASKLPSLPLVPSCTSIQLYNAHSIIFFTSLESSTSICDTFYQIHAVTLKVSLTHTADMPVRVGKRQSPASVSLLCQSSVAFTRHRGGRTSTPFYYFLHLASACPAPRQSSLALLLRGLTASFKSFALLLSFLL